MIWALIDHQTGLGQIDSNLSRPEPGLMVNVEKLGKEEGWDFVH
jgi:hypothetical protein